MLAGLRILLVDDDFDTCEFISHFLEMQGCWVKAVLSAQAGFETFQQWQPDLLISDIAMPEEDGYSLICRIRAAEAQNGKQMPAIAMTAYTLEDEELSPIGFQAYLAKPVDFEQLIETIIRLGNSAKQSEGHRENVA